LINGTIRRVAGAFLETMTIEETYMIKGPHYIAFAAKSIGYEDARDIVYDCFVKCLERYEVSQDEFGAIWFMMVRNAMIDVIRATKFRRENAPPAVNEKLDWRKIELKRLTGKLSSRLRPIIEYYLKGYSPVEISLITGRAYQTVRNQKAEAIREMRGRV
jgi:RNA polymerase sigma factor (sigma-70 family)